jgi:putative ABC transport system permease protein
MGESVTIGLIGGGAGIGLGLAGAAIIDKVAPKLTAVIPSDNGLKFSRAGLGGPAASGGAPVSIGPGGALGNTTQSIPVHWAAAVTLDVIVLAVALAIVGGLLSGSFGSARIARLRPADALARVD